MIANFPVREELTAIAITYRNRRMIADQVLPRVQVGVQAFSYTKNPLGEGFTLPESYVGRRSQPNQVESSGEETTDKTRDYALDDPIPGADIANQPNRDLQGEAAQWLANLIELGREVRVAAKVFNAASYAVGNKEVLAGSSQWSHPDSNPIVDVQDARDSMVMPGNILVVGRSVATALSRNPAVIAAVFGPNGGTGGVASMAQVAAALELEAIYVGESFVNTSKDPANPSLARVWGKHAALIYRDSLATAERGTTFGFTAQWGGRIAGSWEDKNIGMRGGIMVRVGESVQEVIAANNLGYFFENAVA